MQAKGSNDVHHVTWVLRTPVAQGHLRGKRMTHPPAPLQHPHPPEDPARRGCWVPRTLRAGLSSTWGDGLSATASTEAATGGQLVSPPQTDPLCWWPGLGCPSLPRPLPIALGLSAWENAVGALCRRAPTTPGTHPSHVQIPPSAGRPSGPGPPPPCPRRRTCRSTVSGGSLRRFSRWEWKSELCRRRAPSIPSAM